MLLVREFPVDEQAEGGQRPAQFRRLTARCREQGVARELLEALQKQSNNTESLIHSFFLSRLRLFLKLGSSLEEIGFF